MLRGKTLLWLAVAGAMVLPVAGASAAPTKYDVAQSCTVQPKLHYTFDGVDRTPPKGMLGNGNPLGFICSGTTYVPLRWLAQQLQNAVMWTGRTKTIAVASSGASQDGTRFHVAKVSVGSGGTTVSVDVANATSRTRYVSFTIQFEDGYGHVLGTLEGPQSGADAWGKVEVAAGATRTLTAAGQKDFAGYVAIHIVPWADACPVACPPLPG